MVAIWIYSNTGRANGTRAELEPQLRDAGSTRPKDRAVLYLGGIQVKGEKGLLRIPAQWLVRLRYNPFCAYLADRSLDWIATANTSALSARGSNEADAPP